MKRPNAVLLFLVFAWVEMGEILDQFFTDLDNHGKFQKATKQPGLGSAPNGGDCKGIRTKIAFYSALGTRYINYL